MATNLLIPLAHIKPDQCRYILAIVLWLLLMMCPNWYFSSTHAKELNKLTCGIKWIRHVNLKLFKPFNLSFSSSSAFFIDVYSQRQKKLIFDGSIDIEGKIITVVYYNWDCKILLLVLDQSVISCEDLFCQWSWNAVLFLFFCLGSLILILRFES